MVWAYLKGVLIVGLLGGIASAMIFAPLGMLAVGIEDASDFVQLEFAVLTVVLYLLFLTVFGTLTLVFINQPILAVFVGSVTVKRAEVLDHIRQSQADAGADAEGFADALDVGGAF